MTVDELLSILAIAADHLAQYRQYSEEMRKIGRGVHISSEFQPEYLQTMIDHALAGSNLNASGRNDSRQRN